MVPISVNSGLNELTCPITLSLPVDPVQTNCGHIFERIAIEVHLNRNTTVCPIDKKEITELNPQVKLKTEIHAFIRNNPDQFENKTPEQLQAELETEYKDISSGAQLRPLPWLAKEVGSVFILSLPSVIRNGLFYGLAAGSTAAGLVLAAGVESITTLSALYAGTVTLLLIPQPAAKGTMGLVGIIAGFVMNPAAVLSIAAIGAKLGGCLGFSKGLLIGMDRRAPSYPSPIRRIREYKNPAIAIGGTLLAGVVGGPVAATATVAMLSLRILSRIFPTSLPSVVIGAADLIGDFT